jgi:sugar lactone lactonase YvrE
MFTRSRCLTGLSLLLLLAPLGCGRTSLLGDHRDAGARQAVDGAPVLDGAILRGDTSAPDAAGPRPDTRIDSSPDMSVDPPVRVLDTNPDSPTGPRLDLAPDLRVDFPPDTHRDSAADRSPDTSSDRGREVGDTAPDRALDGPAVDRSFDSVAPLPDLPVDTLPADGPGIDASPEVRPLGLSVLAGVLAGPGGLDGIGPDAQFYFPGGAALDGAGNLYVADSANNTIRKIVLATREVTTIAGQLGETGSDDGLGADARFFSPQGLAADEAGNLYIADSVNSTVRKLVLASNQVTTIAGTAGQSGHLDGRGPAARFQSPAALALDGAGNLFVTDMDNTIRKIVLGTGDVTTVAGQPGVSGSQDGIGTAALFTQPQGLAADGAGHLYVADTENRTIRKIVLATGTVTTLAGSVGVNETIDGIGSAAGFASPQGLALDGAGDLFVADYYGNKIRKVVLATAAVSSLPQSEQWQWPNFLAYDGAGHLFVTEGTRHTVFQVSLPTFEMTTIVGRPSSIGGNDGVGAEARFNGPSGLASDNQGGVFVADTFWNTIRMVDSASGRVTTLAGSIDGSYGNRDGLGTEARFDCPSAVAYDGQGILYITDTNNQLIRKLVLATGMVSTVAGTPGANESVDGQGPSAHFFAPMGLALDGTGNLFVADRAGQTIRKLVLADASVTTLAGTASAYGSDDGIGALARFNSPSGLTSDGAGNLFVADTGNCTVRRIAIATRLTTTLAGAPGTCEGGDGAGSSAHFQSPVALAMDSAGRLLVADDFDNTVRRIDLSTKQVTTIIGHSGRWQTVPGPLPAYVADPAGLAVLSSGDIAIADSSTNVILLARF